MFKEFYVCPHCKCPIIEKEKMHIYFRYTEINFCPHCDEDIEYDISTTLMDLLWGIKFDRLKNDLEKRLCVKDNKARCIH